jgi:hypothetical protein
LFTPLIIYSINFACIKIKGMKNSLLALVATLFCNIAVAGTLAFAQPQPNAPDSLLKTTVINVYDTVVFDLTQEVNTVSTVEFPVYFLSDDTVNALDFSLKFDLSKFAFDTIFNLTNYLNVVSNLAADSVLRLTSYSLQRISNDTPLVSIRFTKLTGQPLCNPDIDSIYYYPVHGYLNGDPCMVKITECNTTGVSEIKNDFIEVTAYPNPSTGDFMLNVQNAPDNTTSITVADVTGRMVQNIVRVSSDAPIRVSSLLPGLYIAVVTNNKDRKVLKLIKVN